MPYDGSGNFTIINNFEEDRINGVSIDSLKMDNNFNDIANGLNNVMLRSGVSAMAGTLNMASHRILNVSNGTTSTDAVNKGQMDTALSAKQATVTGGASTITSSNLTANRALVSSSSGKVAVSAVTATELGYLSGVTSNIQTSVVHLSGAETITGAKTFTSGYKSNISVMYNDYITKGTAPSSNTQYINMYMVGDSRTSGDSNALGLFRTYVTTSNIVYSTMQAFKNVASSGASSALRTYYNTDQNKFGVELQALNTSTDTNESMSLSTNATDSTRIPTMGWVNNPATSTNVVHRSGDETIGGAKTFTGDVVKKISNIQGFRIQHTGLIKGTAPSADAGTQGQFVYQDKNGLGAANRLGGMTVDYNTNGSIVTRLSAFKPESGSSSYANIQVIYPASGDAYTYAPTPSSSSDHSTKIATTDWCQTAFANAIGTPRDVTILWGNGTGTGSPTEFSLSEKFTNFEQIGFVCSTDSGGGREMCIQSTYWLNWLLSNSGNNSVVLGHGGQSNFYIKSYTASSNPSTNTKFKVEYEDGIAYYIFGINRKVKTVTNPLA